MPTDALLYSLIGLILALSGFGYYAIEVWKAYKEEKRKIEEDLWLSQKYAPENAMSKVMVYIMMRFTGVVYVILLITLLLVFSEGKGHLENSITLTSELIMLMGAVVLIANISMIPLTKDAVKDIVYQPREIPKDILSETNLEKRYRMIREYYEKEGLNTGAFNFGKHTILLSFPETLLIYALLTDILVMTFTGLMSREVVVFQDIDSGLASSIFFAGVLYVVLCLPTPYFMKKASELPIEGKDFAKRILMATYGLSLPTIGLAIMIYTMLPLLAP